MTVAVNIFFLGLSVKDFFVIFAALQKLPFVDFFCYLSLFLNSGLDTVPCRIFGSVLNTDANLYCSDLYTAAEIRLAIVIISLIL